MSGENSLSYPRLVDFPTRIPPEDRSDACRAQTQHADDSIDGRSPIAHKQDIGSGFLHAPAWIAVQSVKTANGVALRTIRTHRQSFDGRFLVASCRAAEQTCERHARRCHRIPDAARMPVFVPGRFDL